MNKQKIIDEVLEECRKQLNKAYSDSDNDIELTGTDVALINENLETVVHPVELFEAGTLLNCGGWEAFCIVNSEGDRWVTINGEQYSDEQLADLVRHNGAKVTVIHWGL